MGSDTRIPEFVHILNGQTDYNTPVPGQSDNILDELTFLTYAECQFLRDIFQRLPRVQKGFHHFLGLEPEDRVGEAVRLLAKEPRRSWTSLGVPFTMVQSVAGHQTDGMRLAFVVAAGNHDPEHIARMFAVHDLAKSLTGDFIPGGVNKDPITKAEKQKLERIVMSFLLEEHPEPDDAREIRAHWEEYKAGQTPDAIMAHDINKLEMVMQAQFYESLYPDLKKPLREMWDYANDHLKTSQARALLDELTAQHPRPHPLKSQGGQVFSFPWPV